MARRCFRRVGIFAGRESFIRAYSRDFLRHELHFRRNFGGSSIEERFNRVREHVAIVFYKILDKVRTDLDYNVNRAIDEHSNCNAISLWVLFYFLAR